jgi:sulfate adenylyltransferase subunit 1 (EFTu-like GTPase family)
VATASAFLDRLGFDDVVSIPVSALTGGNVVDPEPDARWYDGPTLLGVLEEIDVEAIDTGTTGARLAVQLVLREPADGKPVRHYAGTLSGAPLSEGDQVVVLPSGARTTVKAIHRSGTLVGEAAPGLAVTVHLADDVDVARGDVIAAVDDPAVVTREIDTTICWFGAQPLQVGSRVLVKHATRTERAVVRAITGRLDLDTLDHVTTDAVALNDIAEVRLALAGPIAVDVYDRNRATGGLLLIDESTNATVGAGMVRSTGDMVRSTGERVRGS